MSGLSLTMVGARSICGMDAEVEGDEPLAGGMRISVRVRRDFVVSDAGRFLRPGRRAYVEITPGATEADAERMVTSAADAMFALIERAGMIGQNLDDLLHSAAADGLTPGGQAARLTFDQEQPLPSGRCWFGFPDKDVFALPPGVS